MLFRSTLQFIFDINAALHTLHRILKPGGVVLATCHGIGQYAKDDLERWGEYWRFTRQSAGRLYRDIFGEQRVEVEGHGNVLAAVAFLEGLAAEELTPRELDHHDPNYEVLITVRARKAWERHP